jgi:uncharacterized YigZ family protein
MSAETFVCLRELGEAELRFKNSRFLGSACRCDTATAAEAHLERLRGTHEKANHHVSAWRLLDPRTGLLAHRYDDDGEPGGTAGRPVLQVLESQRVVNAVIVVVRYFGGVKLGAGGLVRAYAATATAALGATQLVPFVRLRRVRVEIPYGAVPLVEKLVAREGWTLLARHYEQEPVLEIELPEARVVELRALLLEATAGRARVSEGYSSDDG